MVDMTKVAVPATGTYARRAEVLRAALEAEIVSVFGDKVPFERTGTKEKPHFRWELPERVTVSVDRYRGADPNVGVRRSDPIKDPPDDVDWKYESRDRSYDTKAYDVASIMALAKKCVDYNRRKREEHEANEASMKRELDGIGMIPEG